MLSCTKHIKNIQNNETYDLDAGQFYSSSQYHVLYNKILQHLILVNILYCNHSFYHQSDPWHKIWHPSKQQNLHDLPLCSVCMDCTKQGNPYLTINGGQILNHCNEQLVLGIMSVLIECIYVFFFWPPLLIVC